MTILTLRRIREDRFEVTGPDIEPVTFKTRVEARDWCLTHYQGSPIREVGGRKRGTPKATVATAELAEILERRPDLKGKSIEAVRRILRREARLSLSPQNFKNTRMNPAALPVLESVDTEWDRACAFIGADAPPAGGVPQVRCKSP